MWTVHMFSTHRRETLHSVGADAERMRFVQEIVKFTTATPQSDSTVAYTPVLTIARPPIKTISVTANSL